MKRWVVSALVVLCLGTLARADGGRVVLYGGAGPYLLTVFSAPSPLRAGRIELSALLQDAHSQDPELGADVEIALIGATLEGGELRARATHAEATNRWLYVAWFDVEAEGRYELEVRVRGERGEGLAQTPLDVGPRLPPLLEQWPLMGLPFLVIVLYAVHQWRRRVSRRAFPRESRRPL